MKVLLLKKNESYLKQANGFKSRFLKFNLLLNILGIVITISSALLMLGSIGVVFIPPAKLGILAYIGFSFPPLFIINLAIFLFWFIKMRTRMLIPLAAMIIMLPFWNNTFQFPTTKSQTSKSTSKEFSILSYNVRMFDVYGWSKTKDSSKKIFKLINSSNADVILIQEFYADNGNGFLNESKVISYLHKYPFKKIFYDYGNKNKGSGLAVFSKYPVENGQFIPFKSSTNASMSIDVKIQSKTIRLFNNHLESLRLSKEEVETMDSLPNSIESNYINKVKTIANKINSATSIRAKQVEKLKILIADSPFPVIVCGDFNDTPISYAYNTIKGDLNDPFNKHGKWFGGTYNGLFFQPRIDYILHSKVFESVDYKTTKVFYSDHFPLYTEFILN